MCFHPGHSSYGLEGILAMWSSWAHPWALSRLLGPVTSLGSSLDDRHSNWASRQLGKAPEPLLGWNQLGKAGEGWTRPLGLNRPELAGTTLWHIQNTLAHSFPELCWLTPESAVFGSYGNLWPHIGYQNVTGPPGALLFDRDQRLH